MPCLGCWATKTTATRVKKARRVTQSPSGPTISLTSPIKITFYLVLATLMALLLTAFNSFRTLSNPGLSRDYSTSTMVI